MISGTLYLVFIQVASRLLTFGGNQVLLRYLSPSLLGLAVQLELLSVTILYTARESLRVALQRQPEIESADPANTNMALDKVRRRRARLASQQIVNVSHLTLPVGLAAGLCFGYAYIRKSDREVLDATDFDRALKLYGIATLLEILSEPCFAIVQQNMLYKVRARAETSAAVARCVSACCTAILMNRLGLAMSVLPFAVGQLCYATILSLFYLKSVLPVSSFNEFSLLPSRLDDSMLPLDPPRKVLDQYWLSLFSKPLLSLAATFYTQSIFKLLLTQGDALVLSFVADLPSQGAFALASNYGGLLSRLLFQPVEESSRGIFGRLLATSTVEGEHAALQTEPVPGTASVRVDGTKLQQETSRTALRDPIDAPKNATLDSKGNVDLALAHLATTFRLYTLMSLPFLALLPSIFPVLITNVVGQRWSNSSTASLLSAYAYYLPFLAINGILDAFVTSAATPTQLRTQSLVMIAITLIYGLAALLLMSPAHTSHADSGIALERMISGFDLGPASLVWANMLNMSLRIAYSIQFVRNWIQRHYAALQPPMTDTKHRTNVRATNAQAKSGLLLNSLPPYLCCATAIGVGLWLNTSIQLDFEHKSAINGMIKGINVKDLGVLVAGTIILGTSIIIFEHQLLLDTITSILPKRFASTVKQYMSRAKNLE